MQPKHPIAPIADFWQRFFLENILLVASYWGLAHLTFILFRSLGILPMPIWPPAALAIVAAFYRGWFIAPGIAIGTIFANTFSLGSPFGYACSIALMNTLGPLLGAWIMRRQITSRLLINNLPDLLVCFLAIYLLPPMLAASGGIGFKYLLGMMPASELMIAWLKWTTAHSLGSLLFATPIFAWMAFREPRNEP